MISLVEPQKEDKTYLMKFNKLLAFVLSISLTAAAVPAARAGAQSADPVIGLSKLQSGIVTVTVPAASAKAPVRKLLVQKGGVKQYYTLSPASKVNVLPLTSGSGDYKLAVYENVGGSSYKEVSSANANVKLATPFEPFLQSVQPVNWNATMAAVRKARQLTAGLKTNEQKAGAIYAYLAKRMKYDYKKANGSLPSTYTPNVESTFLTAKGICYDTSALYAAMLRSVGVPAKVAMGTAPNIKVYHAWNQVYLGSKGWVTMDVTVDSSYVQAGKAVTKYKKASLYKVDKTV